MSLQPTGPIKIDTKALHTIANIAVVDAARAYVEADVTVQPGSLTLTLVEQKDIFARVNVSDPQGGGYAVVLKRVNGIWVALLAGQGLPGKDAAKKYGLPEGWFSTEY